MPLHDLSDVTFIIPVFIDCPERLCNLQNNLRHLTALFTTSILIGEMPTPGQPLVAEALQEFNGRFRSVYIEAATPGFHRTRLLNQLLHRVETPLVCNLDCDAVFSVGQYLKAVLFLRWNMADFILPHQYLVVHIPSPHQSDVLAILKERPLLPAEVRQFAEEVWEMGSLGGAIFGKTRVYRNCGGENEHFIGWGWEDNERVARFEKLGHQVTRIPGSFYHLNHPRGSTSSDAHANYYNNKSEFERIERLTKPQLEQEISQWRWQY